MRHILPIMFVLAAAPTMAAEPGDVSVTIYNNNIALIEDVRQIDLPQGRVTESFPGVSAQIRAETVQLSGDGIGIVEQNFDYDLLSPDKLMEKAVGSTIGIVRTNPATGVETRETAKVLAANGGIVMQVGDHVEVLRDDGLPARVIFDRVPPNLRARPTLSVTMDSARAGRRPVTLSYLTPGLGWQADYVALFDRAKGSIDLQGWITLTNNSGTTYDNAETLLVAGSPQTEQGQRRSYAPPPPASGMRDAGTESGSAERLGDYYLYPLAERTTIASAQTKQVSFLDISDGRADNVYIVDIEDLETNEDPVPAGSFLAFSNSQTGGLGRELPAGTVRVYMRDAAGQPQFIGENTIGHTPAGSEIELRTGDAFDVKVKPTLLEQEDRGDTERYVMQYEVTNARPEPVSVWVSQTELYGETKIVRESQRSTRPSAERVTWKVAVPANGSTSITATFDVE